MILKPVFVWKLSKSEQTQPPQDQGRYFSTTIHRGELPGKSVNRYYDFFTPYTNFRLFTLHSAKFWSDNHTLLCRREKPVMYWFYRFWWKLLFRLLFTKGDTKNF